MELATDIVNIPLIQGLGIVLIIVAAERMGIPLVAFIRSMLKLDGSGKEEKTPIWAEKLVNHFNHEQTEILKSIRDSLQQLGHEISEINRTHEEWEKYGVPPSRDCDKK